MNFPKRWLDDDNAPPALRDVLRAGDDMDPPEGAEQAVWLALAGQLGAAGTAAAGASVKAASAASAKAASAATAGAAGSGTAGAALGGGLLKSILIGTFSGIVAVSGYSAIEPASAPPPQAVTASVAPAMAPLAESQTASPGAAPAPSVKPSAAPSVAPSATAAEAREPAPSAAFSAAAPADSEPAIVAPASSGDAPGSVPAPGSPEERESRLREESEMLNRARAALRGGDTGGAMRLLEQARQKFPSGVLGQEREALTIETLAKSGARDVASARAAAFIKAHPTSPHAARLQTFVLP